MYLYIHIQYIQQNIYVHNWTIRRGHFQAFLILGHENIRDLKKSEADEEPRTEEVHKTEEEDVDTSEEEEVHETEEEEPHKVAEEEEDARRQEEDVQVQDKVQEE